MKRSFNQRALSKTPPIEYPCKVQALDCGFTWRSALLSHRLLCVLFWQCSSILFLFCFLLLGDPYPPDPWCWQPPLADQTIKYLKIKIDLFCAWGRWSHCWHFWSWGKVRAAFHFKNRESVRLRDKPDDVQFLFVLFCFTTAIWLSVFSFALRCKNNLPIAQATKVLCHSAKIDKTKIRILYFFFCLFV